MRSYFSPAKINLNLSVVGRRPDGLHLLDSHFQALSLGDTLTFTPAQHDVLSCNRADIPCAPHNLITRAVHLFREETSFLDAFHIHVEKRVPICAGLGGGSSNVATTLWALNDFAGRPLATATLQALSQRVSADAPFFFSTGAARCTGIGEIVERAAPLEQRVWLYKLPIGLSTPEIFRHLKLSQCGSKPHKYHNDLECVALLLYPELARLKDEVNGYMTGSGSCFFTFEKAQHPPDGVWSTEATSTSRHPSGWYH